MKTAIHQLIAKLNITTVIFALSIAYLIQMMDIFNGNSTSSLSFDGEARIQSSPPPSCTLLSPALKAGGFRLSSIYSIIASQPPMAEC